MAGLYEPPSVKDTFCSGIAAVEDIGGGCLRFHLYVTSHPLNGGAEEKIIVARIVAPMSAVPEAVAQMLAAVGGKIANAVPTIGDLIH